MLKYVYYFCLGALSLGQLVALSKEDSTNVYLFDIFVPVFCLVITFALLYTKRKLFIPRTHYVLLLFVIMSGVSFLFSTAQHSFTENTTASLYLARLISYFWASLCVYNLVRHQLLKEYAFWLSLLFSAVFIAFAGFVQLLFLPDFILLDPSLGWDPHQSRLAGVFFDPNFTGAYLVLGIISGLKIFRSFSKRFWVYFLIGILLLALFLTFSRSAWLMFALVIFIIGIFRSPKLLLFSFVLMFLAYYAVPRVQTRLSGTTDPADSAGLRMISWQNSWQIIQDNYLVGVGYNQYRFIQKEYGFLDPDTVVSHHSAGADSSLLFIFATTGIFGLFFYLLSFLMPFFRLDVSKNVLPLLAILPLMLDALFINSLFYPPIMFLYLSLLACLDVFDF